MASHARWRKPGDKADPDDPGHVGPVITYLTKVNDARTQKVTDLNVRGSYSSD